MRTNNLTTRQLQLEFAICILVFVCSGAWASLVYPEFLTEMTGAGLLTGGGFWWGLQWSTPRVGGRALEPIAVGAGMTLLLGSLISYLELGRPLPLEFLGGGVAVTALLILAVRTWIVPRWTTGKVLLVGCGLLAPALLEALGSRVMGAVEAAPEKVPAGVPFLGDYAGLRNVIATRQPTSIVVDGPDWERLAAPRVLLDCKLNGTVVQTSSAVYERLFERISLETIKATDLVVTEVQQTNRRVMAIQAVYSNLVGLALLVGLSPVLVVLGIAARIAAGPGPVFEGIECAGFQGIPFRHRRFRIRHAVTGETTLIGRSIAALRLTNLPQLINLVRGEMAIFGPQPVRLIFADYLNELSPVYARALSVKPGILSWAQVNRGTMPVQEEHLRTAYDLYYIENVTPIMDLEILVRTVGRR